MSLPRQPCIALGAALLACSILAACASGASSTSEPSAQEPTTEVTAEVTEPGNAPPAGPDLEPQPFVPGGPVGSRDAYDDLLAELDAGLPAELRAEVPWPDLRNPDPIAAQLDIFDMWIWMAANHPEPELVAALTAEGSPSRTDVAAIFGQLDDANQLQAREQQPYRAFDHRAVTFESAGLPLWLSRDVPADAVVLYYQDDAGPLTVRDRDTNEVVEVDAAIPTRQWLSIVVPTNVGWQLYRDILIDPSSTEFEVPEDFAPPSNNDVRSKVQA